MAYLETYSCDQCGKVKKKDENGWLLGKLMSNRYILVSDWNSDMNLISGKDTSHLCSHQCTLNWFSKQLAELTKKSFEDPKKSA